MICIAFVFVGLVFTFGSATSPGAHSDDGLRSVVQQDSSAMNACSELSETCTSTRDENWFLQSKLAVDSLDRWGPFSDFADAVTHWARPDNGAGGGAVLDTVKNVQKEAYDVTTVVYSDVVNAAEEMVTEAHDTIVAAYETIGNFLAHHVQKAFDMLSNLFKCVAASFTPEGDCLGTWAKQSAECIAGRGCQLSIGFPKCSSPGYTKIDEDSFSLSQDLNATVHKGHAEGALLHGQGLEKSEFMNETIPDTNDDNELDSIENQAGLLHIQEDGALITGSWQNDHAHANASDETKTLTSGSVSTSGEFSLHAGVHLNINLENGRVSADIKSRFDFEANLNVATSSSREFDIRKKVLYSKELLRKFVMVGKLPVEVVLTVKVRQNGSVAVGGALSAGVKVKQYVKLTTKLSYNFLRLNEVPSWEHTELAYPDPRVLEPRMSAQGFVHAVYNLHPVFELTVNRIPSVFDFGPQIVVFADAKYHANKCSNANFQVTTNLAGSWSLGGIAIHPPNVAQDICRAMMKQQLALNPGFAVSNCLSKALLKFDLTEAMSGACNIMMLEFHRSSSFPLIKHSEPITTLNLVSYDYGAEVCAPAEEKCQSIKMVPKNWGEEISWALGECGGSQYTSWRESANQNCCLPSGIVELICKDSYGDGWHGGYLLIGGTKYCEDFSSGHASRLDIEWN